MAQVLELAEVMDGVVALGTLAVKGAKLVARGACVLVDGAKSRSAPSDRQGGAQRQAGPGGSAPASGGRSSAWCRSASRDGQAAKLLAAARAGHTGKALRLLHQGVPVDTPSTHGKTALFLAAANGHLHTVQALLRAGAAVEAAEQQFGFTPLMAAAHQGHAHVVGALLAAGASAAHAAAATLHTALHLAAAMGHNDAVELLLRGGAPVEARDWDGDSPLHCATQEGRAQTATLLVSWGASLQARNAAGHTPADLAGPELRCHLLPKQQ